MLHPRQSLVQTHVDDVSIALMHTGSSSIYYHHPWRALLVSPMKEGFMAQHQLTLTNDGAHATTSVKNTTKTAHDLLRIQNTPSGFEMELKLPYYPNIYILSTQIEMTNLL